MILLTLFFFTVICLVPVFAAFIHYGTGIDTTGEHISYSQGRIFSFYGKWLVQRVWVAEAQDDKGVLWYNPFGRCKVCFTTWVVQFSYLALYALYFLTFENPCLCFWQYTAIAFFHFMLVTCSTWVSVRLAF